MIRIEIKDYKPFNPKVEEIYMNSEGEVFDKNMFQIGKVGEIAPTDTGMVIHLIIDKR